MIGIPVKSEKTAESMMIDESSKTLDQIPSGTYAKILILNGGHGIRKRLHQIGFFEGETIYVKRSSRLGGPILVRIHGSEIALGRGMARKIIVQELCKTLNPLLDV